MIDAMVRLMVVGAMGGLVRGTTVALQATPPKSSLGARGQRTLPEDPKSISGMLSHSAGEELHAVSSYGRFAARARSLGDYKTAELFEHIREEEQHHRDELFSRMGEIRYE